MVFIVQALAVTKKMCISDPIFLNQKTSIEQTVNILFVNKYFKMLLIFEKFKNLVVVKAFWLYQYSRVRDAQFLSLSLFCSQTWPWKACSAKNISFYQKSIS